MDDISEYTSFSSFNAILWGIGVFLFVFYQLMKDNKPKNFPRGPRPLPIIGNLHIFAKNPNNPSVVLSDLSKTYGDVIGLKFGSVNVVILNSLDSIREAFVKHRSTLSDRPFIPLIEALSNRKGISRTVSFYHDDPWKKLRKFAFTNLNHFGFGKQSFEEKIKEEARELCNEIRKLSGTPSNLSDVLQTAAGNVINRFCFESRLSPDDKEFNSVLGVLHRIVISNVISSPFNWIPVLRVFWEPAFIQKLRQGLDEVDEWILKKVDEHRESFDANNLRDLTDVYILNEPETRKDKVDPTFLFFILRDLLLAGTQAVADYYEWFILFMIHHPDVQKNCQVEIDEVLGNRAASTSDKAHLPYVQAVIHECFRLRAIGPLGVPHAANEDTVLNGYTIPKGTTIIANMLAIHMDPSHWKNPEKFQPERWISDGRFHMNDAYIPFGMGPRSCLGEALVKQELILFVVALLQRFTFSPVDAKTLPSMNGKLGISYNPYPYSVIVECR